MTTMGQIVGRAKELCRDMYYLHYREYAVESPEVKAAYEELYHKLQKFLKVNNSEV